MTYWEERSLQNELKSDKYSQNQSRLVTRFFGRAKKEMSAKIIEFYRKYADGEGITLQAAKKQLNDPKLLKTTLDEYYALANQLGDEYVKRQLNKIGLSRAISREEFLKLQLNMILSDTYIKYEDITASTLAKQFYDAYYKQKFDFQQFQGFGNNFNTLSINQIVAATTTNWSGKNYSERIWEQRQSLSRKVNRIITTGMITGRSNKEMRQQLEKEVDTSTYNARRLIRTESAYVAGKARLMGYEQNKTKQYQFIATLDLRTSDICRGLDNKIFDVKDATVGVNYPPMHPHCRSTTAPYVPDDILDGDDTRTARGADGETYKVPADMSYQDWYDKHIANDPEALVIEKSIKNIYADTKQFEKYKDVLGKDAPKTLEKFQQMKYTDIDGWKDFKAFTRYKRKFPESNKQYYNINKEIQSCVEQGFINKRIGIAVKPQPKKISDYGSHALKRMIERGFGTEDAQEFINSSAVAFSQAKNTKTAFYSKNGCSVIVNETNALETGWDKTDFNSGVEKIMKVVDKYVK